MKAIIFAAGLGTRIQTITKGLPKALLVFDGVSLLERAIVYLQKNAVTEIIVNVHHQAELIKSFILERKWDIPIYISDETDKLLDTGGALLKVQDFFSKEKDFVAYNVDIITNLNLLEMIEYHRKEGAIATLAVRNRQTSRYLLWDNDNNMIGWENVQKNERILHKEIPFVQAAFSGVHIVSGQIFNYIHKKGAFSITPLYIDLAKNQKIKAYFHNDTYWFDVGKPETYKLAQDYFRNNQLRFTR